ncbi:hypothetical protein EUGRSUZ_E03291 [Eucalyptus grandis]|uniref:Uncharacterized protein n=1 Tax=Eucalyptus grandis TaxID=71139 RepID=A0ACC3KYJ3_EUCGR|nr:hypothetical protein EUGRSUZ_E03291 [Eucalyptus grandis]
MKRNYHVFLSFRGTDVRQGFLSHLYAALDQRGIYTFVDSEELRKGEEISWTLMRAIEESHIAIIVFSEDYASSRWCLEELLKIMECKEKNGLMVFPVFYEVEPREVREGRENYKRAMDNHEYKFGKDSEKVKRWKKALFETGSLSGWELNDRDEADLIQCIVKELSIHLNRTPLHVAKYPVGIDSRVQELIWLSQKESADDDVMMIGLWGPGGIGKTAIAKALYNAMMRQFQVCSFLEQVREKSHRSDGLVTLQKDLLSEILVHPLTIYSVAGGISLIQERLCCKKVLLVLDDVDHMNQLNALAGKGNWFGKGSRIIVTSRDKHLLISHDKNYVYEVKTLKDDEARDLFGQHAFTNSNKVEIRRDLIDGALHYANNLPLALEVITVYDVDGEISLIQERLCCKKVLLVLDDVDDMDQLNALAGKGDWFGKGSRIIVTSRDRHLLTSHDKNYVYEVKTLEDNEAQDLFGQHAFTNSNKVEIRRDLIDGALHYADGLPLALEVRNLNGKVHCINSLKFLNQKSIEFSR